MPAFLRIRYQFTQDRNWKNPEKRSPQKVLARRGHDSPGLCCAKRWRLSRFSEAGVVRIKEKQKRRKPGTGEGRRFLQGTKIKPGRGGNTSGNSRLATRR